jgi:thymidylate synthase ThyX
MAEDRADVFCLTNGEGGLLIPAVQATVLAKYSRSPQSAREILAKLSEEDADKFQEKWVVQYGHNSVAELAVVPVCFERVSIVASKIIESWQRPGYSEKSTRYQVFSRDSFITPPGAPSTMKGFSGRFYDAYDRLHPKMLRRCAELMGEDPNAESPKQTVKARAFDNIRYLLPAGTGTNLAAVVNMLDVRRMVTELRGHPNPEFQDLGNRLHSAALELAPSLVKHTEPDTFKLRVKGLGPLDPAFDQSNPAPYVRLRETPQGPGKDYEHAAFESQVIDMYGMSWQAFCQYMEGRPGHAEVPDVFKTILVSFDIMMDYGAFRDLQRHRRCEQYVEPLTSYYGYVVPDDIAGSELEPEYREAMESLSAYDDDRVIHDVDLMQYMVPLGYLHRSRFQMDLKELYYVVELRTKPQGHISYRRIAWEMFRQAQARYPGLMEWCRAVNPTAVGEHT